MSMHGHVFIIHLTLTLVHSTLQWKMFVKIAVVCLAILVALLFRSHEDPDAAFNIVVNASYDYIIVGSGSAGAVVANRLSEDENVTVLLIEAGGSELEMDSIRRPLDSAFLQQTKVDWSYYTVPQKAAMMAINEQKGYWPRGRVLGGSSSINYMAYVRGSRYDFDQWEKEGCSGWGYKDILPYFLKIEDIQVPELLKSDYHSTGGYLTVSETKVTSLLETYRRASEEIGYKTIDMNGEHTTGFSYIQSSIVNGERCSTAKAYIRPILTRPNLHISLNSLVTKVLIKDKTAYGIEMVKDNRKKIVLVNKEVILSAGAINTPQILMLSGIGPKQHLEKHKIKVHADLPVGQNLEDHLMFFQKYNTKEKLSVSTEKVSQWWHKWQYWATGKGIYSFSGIEANIFDSISNKDSDKPMWPDYQLLFFSGAADKEFLQNGLPLNFKQSTKDLLKTRAFGNEFTITVVPLHLESTGSVTLNSSDPFDYPLIDPNYLSKQRDIDVIIEAIRKTNQLAKSKAFHDIGAKLNRQDFKNICDKKEFDSDEYWECLIRHYAVTQYHPSCTCRMGSINDPTSVVDPELRVKGISSLRVADASVMRHVTSGNTNAPTIMIGEKASDLIRGKDTVQQFRIKIRHLNI